MARCSAHGKKSKLQCRQNAILGGVVCRMHGGGAPQVRAAANRRLELAHITPERTLLEIARIAYSDIASFFNADNTLKKPSELDEDQRATLASFEAAVQNIAPGDGKQDLIHKFKAWDKTKALEMLAKHFGMLVDKIEHSGSVSFEIRQRLQAAQLRETKLITQADLLDKAKTT